MREHKMTLLFLTIFFTLKLSIIIILLVAFTLTYLLLVKKGFVTKVNFKTNKKALFFVVLVSVATLITSYKNYRVITFVDSTNKAYVKNVTKVLDENKIMTFSNDSTVKIFIKDLPKAQLVAA
jgi:hypothetical protein